MWTWKKGFIVLLVLMAGMTGLLYTTYNNRFVLNEIIPKIKHSVAVFAASYNASNETFIAKLRNLRLDMVPSTQNYKLKLIEKASFHDIVYITEEEALKDPPLTDVRKTIHLEKSSIHLKGNRRMYNTGEHIAVQITLRDRNGMTRTRGGDELRIRMFNTKQKAYINGHVTDHNNGSYTATLPAIWAGNQTISVWLAYSREFIRAIYYIRQQTPGTRGIDAVFKKGNQKEATFCHAHIKWLQNLTYPEICNLTLDNGGMSWYCGRPKNRLLSCRDWSFTAYSSPLPVLPLTKAEKEIFKPKWEMFPEFTTEIKGNNLRERNDLPPCHSYPRQLLWNQAQPTGYFYDNEWHLLHCQQPNRSVYRPCLHGKHLMISGDSTSRQWFSFLMKYLECKLTTERWTTEKWHRKSKCFVKSMNLTIEWIPHAQPFMPGDSWDMHKYAVNCLAKDIGEIGDKQNVIFVIHMYMHFTATHHSIYQDRMQYISNSVRNILKKNNNVTFMIKGPHTYKIPDDRGNRLNDYFGYVYKDIMFKAFKGIHDKIVFMDQAALSTAKGLVKNHPPEDVVKEAVFQMFDYICK